MYKTVRQGENSLQYTILPQTEEVLSNSGVKGKGRDYTASIQDERSMIKFILCSMIIGAITTFAVVTIGAALLWTGVIPNQFPMKSDQIKFNIKAFNYTAVHSTLQAEKSQTRKKELAHDLKLTPGLTVESNYSVIPLNKSSVSIGDSGMSTEIQTESSTTVTTTANITTTSNMPSTSGRQWILPALKRLQSSTTILPSTSTVADKATTFNSVIVNKLTSPYSHQRESNTDLMLRRDRINWTDYEDDDDDEYDTTKTLTTKITATKNTIPILSNIKSTEILATVPLMVTSNSTSDSSSVTLNKTVKSDTSAKNKTKIDRFMEMKEHILDDDDEDYKDLLTDENDVSEPAGSDEVKMSQAKSSWLQTRWPFVDPSSYFQWTDYSARDNLLLPAILSAAFSALLVLAVLCYALRRRQHCKRRIQEIGNLTSDLQAEDNAILLTAENPSEED